MKNQYSFSVFRYVHDVVTQEFVNVGVVVYSPQARFVSAIFSQKYYRLSKMFGTIDGSHYRHMAAFIEAKILEFGDRIREDLPLEKSPESIDAFLQKIQPQDDSSLQFSKSGSGVTNDLPATLEKLYQRYVEQYDVRGPRPTRSNDDVWRVYRSPLETRQVLKYFRPKVIAAKDYSQEFEYAWKNQVWHALQPVSFDLAERESILDKATSWLGRAESLRDSGEKFKLYFLTGRPRNPKLAKAYVTAENIVHKTNVKHDFIREEDAEDFAESLKKDIERHSPPA